MNAVNTLMSLIHFRSDSNSRNNSDMISFIYDMFSNCEDIKIIPSEDNKLKSIAIGVNTTLEGLHDGIMFSGHMDTLTQLNEDVFPFIKDNKVYGPGAVRMKYFAACLAQAIPKLKQSPKPVIIMLSYGQVNNSLGIKDIIKFIDNNNIKPDLCVIGEPTRFDILTCNDGTYQYRMKISSNGGHGTMRDNIDNPLYLSADFTKNVQELNHSQNEGSVNIGLLEGGRSIHLIPSMCTLYYEIRTNSLEFKNKVDCLVDKTINNARYMNNGISVENILLDTSIPVFNNSGTKWTEKLSSIGSARLPDYRATTGAGFFQEAGIDTIIYGAGDMGVAHTENEHISISDLDKYTEKLCEIVKLYNQVKNGE